MAATTQANFIETRQEEEGGVAVVGEGTFVLARVRQRGDAFLVVGVRG